MTISFKDLNYFPLDVESNIYGLTSLELEDRSTKVLVAASDCKIYCISYSKFKPHTREVEFTYIPNSAKIIAISSLKRGTDDFVIGITHSLGPSVHVSARSSSVPWEVNDLNKQATHYFNIYASGSMETSLDLDYVAQGCQTIRLRFVPYHLFAFELIEVTNASSMQTRRKPLWLLSGGDNLVHAFAEERPYQSFSEIPIEDCLPEIKNVNGIVIWIDALNIERSSLCKERVVALGFEEGSVKLYHSALSSQSFTFELVRYSSFDTYSTIITSIRLFKVKSEKRSTLRDKLEHQGNLKHVANDDRFSLNLLTVSSTESSLIFEDVLNNGLSQKYELPDSCRLDCVTTSAVGDLDVDGYNEILLGTHGREVLSYQYEHSIGKYRLDRVLVLNYPVFSLAILDLTGDALNDVVVLLASGVIVIQSSVNDVIQVCRQRLKNVVLKLMGK